MKKWKNMAALSLAALLAVGTAAPGFAEETAKEALTRQLVDSANGVVGPEGESQNIYSNIEQASRADSLPAQFDLRDRGVVPAIRNQGNFGTCWSFASIGASEISILSDLGLTAEEYLERFGKEMNLSERHLAWFSTVPIVQGEGMSEHDLAQVGEGRTLLYDDGSASAHLDTGGVMGYASGLFASGIGPVAEELVPYTANDGSDSTAEDWSVDEALRFRYLWELKDSSILPTPAERDAEGNYVYNPIATEMIKQELLAGRAVSFAYNADQAMSPEAVAAMYRDMMIKLGVPEEDIDLVFAVLFGELEKEDLSEEQLWAYTKAKICLIEEIPYDEITDEEVDEEVASCYASLEEVEPTEEDLQAAAEAEAAARAAAERLGYDYDELMEEMSSEEEQEEASYMNEETSAHYVWEAASANHAVVIVGYDDNYPASNFRAEHLPPADGAWIVRNSWGDDYAIDGYFYLSYYDQSFCLPETFEYVTDADSIAATGLTIEEYDFMPATAVSNAAVQSPVYLANEFTVESDSVLTYVSAMTANYDTNVTVAVYLLGEDSTSPIDGELLDVRTTNFKYAGYHRIMLSQHYRLPEGAKISVVETQRYNDADGMYYALPYTIGTNCEFSETFNTMLQDAVLNEGVEGRVGRGESFIGVDGAWYDWADVLADVKATSARINDFAAFDNHSIKIYLYRLDDIYNQHVFGEPVPYAGGSVQLCTDCGYSLVEK